MLPTSRDNSQEMMEGRTIIDGRRNNRSGSISSVDGDRFNLGEMFTRVFALYSVSFFIKSKQYFIEEVLTNARVLISLSLGLLGSLFVEEFRFYWTPDNHCNSKETQRTVRSQISHPRILFRKVFQLLSIYLSFYLTSKIYQLVPFNPYLSSYYQKLAARFFSILDMNVESLKNTKILDQDLQYITQQPHYVSTSIYTKYFPSHTPLSSLT